MKKNFLEFFRYSIVGGIAFIIDFSVLVFIREVIFSGNDTELISLIAVTIAFIVAFAFNYIASLLFVFTSEKQKKKGRDTKSVIATAIIAISGLILTELGMYLGEFILLFNYMFVKIVVSLLILFWNYIMRRILIFNEK